MSATGRGRPLRFIGAVVLGWIVIRAAMLWPGASSAIPAGPVVGLRAALRHEAVARRGAAVAPPRIVGGIRPRVKTRAIQLPARVTVIPAAFPLSPSGEALPVPVVQEGQADYSGVQTRGSVPPAPLPRRDHWQASSWLVLRPGHGIGAAPGAGQLGGSQYGLRLAYGLGGGRRLAAYARVAGPVHGRGAEAAIGIDWHPLRAPVRLAVEQRLGLDGVRGGPAAGLIAGVDQRLANEFRLEAYGQAGAVLRTRTEPYVDGAVRLTDPVAARRRLRLALGVGAWGAAQRATQRLDIGPTLVATLPIGATQARLALDWRQRVAGNARPGSGLALTLGSDF